VTRRGGAADSDKRLIEDAIPIDVISRVCGDEKTGGRKGHPATLHLWWARRPLAASRAAVYAALMPAAGRRRTTEEDKEWFRVLCRWDTPDHVIDKARQEILAAHDGVAPKVVDLFAGGGAIPLEAARLGCEVIANELNPVAHLIERMMLEYPQRFLRLADDVRKWGTIWVDRAWEQLKDLYPPIDEGQEATPLPGMDGVSGGRRPLAYLWTRTVRCPNPAMPTHDVHLVRQTWLGKKAGRMVALKPVVNHDNLTIRYDVVTAPNALALGFDPADGSKGGQVACRICGMTVTSGYIKAEGRARRMDAAPLVAVVLKRPKKGNKRSVGREYIPVGRYVLPQQDECYKRLADLPVEPLTELLPDTQRITGGTCMVYGMSSYQDIFTPRQILTLFTLVSGLKRVHQEVIDSGVEPDRGRAIATALAMALNRTADRLSALCRFDTKNEGGTNTFARQALPMVWDFCEANPFAGASADIRKYVEETADLIERLRVGGAASCLRGSASMLPLAADSQDAVITDPPYYDNISYADLSDFFYVWLKRSVGHLYETDLGGELTPKRSEAVVAPYRHGGDRQAARAHYEDLMAQSFAEAHRILKPDAPLVCVYSHKTATGWASLVEALRRAGFMITEAWPIDTEMAERTVGQGTASLASSIFLVARKRSAEAGVGTEGDVLDDLDQIIKERLARLEQVGVTGADLVIATVGAGLRALTRYERVEQDNGEPLPAERFLEMVQTRVLDAIFGEVAGVDNASRFYIAAQYSYGYGAVPFDEVNNLARMCGADLGGLGGLSSGANPLVAKSQSTVALRDYVERGVDERLGYPDSDTGQPASLIDVAHGVLWRIEFRPRDLRDYLLKVAPDAAQIRQVIQALAGKALRSSGGGSKSREALAAETLLVSWRNLVSDAGLL
jgi:putative DNA methylase